MNFERLANEHKNAVYRQMIRACGNREDAEDVLIEALLKAYQHLDQLQGVVAFRPWLAQIGRRVWQLKKKEVMAPLLQLSVMQEEGEEPATGGPGIEAEVQVKRMKELLGEAVQRLPKDTREVFELRDIEELSGEEVCARLGISLTAMKSRLHRGRKLIREYMEAALLPKSRQVRRGLWK